MLVVLHMSGRVANLTNKCSMIVVIIIIDNADLANFAYWLHVGTWTTERTFAQLWHGAFRTWGQAHLQSQSSP
jgi:hypothetical protein